MIAEHFCATVFIWVHVIKATQYTGLKATPKNTGKKATKIYRNIGYNEYTGSKATEFSNTQKKRLHFLNIQEIGYIFWKLYIIRSRKSSDYSGNQLHCKCLQGFTSSLQGNWEFDLQG